MLLSNWVCYTFYNYFLFSLHSYLDEGRLNINPVGLDVTRSIFFIIRVYLSPNNNKTINRIVLYLALKPTTKRIL